MIHCCFFDVPAFLGLMFGMHAIRYLSIGFPFDLQCSCNVSLLELVVPSPSLLLPAIGKTLKLKFSILF